MYDWFCFGSKKQGLELSSCFCKVFFVTSRIFRDLFLSFMFDFYFIRFYYFFLGLFRGLLSNILDLLAAKNSNSVFVLEIPRNSQKFLEILSCLPKHLHLSLNCLCVSVVFGHRLKNQILKNIKISGNKNMGFSLLDHN
jgi:hypothetical protein